MAAPERLVLLAALLFACSSASDDRTDGAPTITTEQRLALSALRYDERPPDADPSNRFADDPAARRLGQRLFFEPRFSGRLLEGDNDGTVATLGVQGDPGRVSCAGCHLPESDFVDTRSPHGQVSLGAQWTLRKTPSLIDVAYAPLYNWDGRRDAIWNQALGVMESNREFNSGRLFVAEQVFRLHRSEYEAVFGELPPLSDAARFPQLAPEDAGCVEVNTSKGSRFVCRGLPGDSADYDSMTATDQALVSVVAANVGKALEAYIRQLRCGASRFDDWLDGDSNALTASEQRGALLFVGRAGCAKCHGGARLTDDAFHNVGLGPAVVAVAIQDTDDRGAALGIGEALKDPTSSAGPLSDGDRHRLPTTLGPDLEGAFRTPGLRCNARHPSFMHTGQLRNLAQVVEFFDRGGDAAGHYPGANELTALGLSEQQKLDLVAFLGTLMGPGPDAALRTPGSEDSP
ncbi:MAG TPA: cytochrome c peroxidase [Polyangiaceae bacterium]|nr:cytochrome c peroxidase [Polyangiaceae bacterium]